jgi:hypothetical protein
MVKVERVTVVPADLAKKYDLRLPSYPGTELCVELEPCTDSQLTDGGRPALPADY